MIFKNKRGMDAWGTLASAVLIVALILLVIWAIFPKIKAGANGATNPAENSCGIIADGVCFTATDCPTGTSKITAASCPDKAKVCCTKPLAGTTAASICEALSGNCVTPASNGDCPTGQTQVTTATGCTAPKICCK